MIYGRLANMKTVYLCGPILGCTDEECRDWRQLASKVLKCETLDPMRRDYRGIESSHMREIVELDKIDIGNSNIILVNHDRPSVGTSMEIIYAWERGKMIISVYPENLVVSPWLKYHSHFIFHSFKEAFDFINKCL